jgi:DNA-3-methyladenine glycosylase I
MQEESTREKRIRCPWAVSELAIAYHDKEWGLPQHNDRILFEFLVLEGAQAGLSWETILRKRDHYRQVYDQFEPVSVAGYNADKIESLMSDPGIIRNRRKIESSIQNARAYLQIQSEFGSFDQYVWQFVHGKPIINSWKTLEEIPSQTQESEALSRDLRARGFSFIGPTICYAFMQAVGLVNDHLDICFRYKELCG